MGTRKTTNASQTMTLRLDPGDVRRLDALARATNRSKAWLAAQAVKAYLDLNEWQVRAIHEAITKADRRDAGFFTNEEVTAWLASWGTPRERKPPPGTLAADLAAVIDKNTNTTLELPSSGRHFDWHHRNARVRKEQQFS